jgi:trk system potassium uptake protein
MIWNKQSTYIMLVNWSWIVFGFLFLVYCIYKLFVEQKVFLKATFIVISILAVIHIYTILSQLVHNVESNIYGGIFNIIFMVFVFFSSISYKLSSWGTDRIHPSILFVLSFFFLIFISSILLYLPKSTTRPIDYIDALFTATSAATVTGLAVLDTSKDFTNFGRFVILITIQFGGLGILTFTTLFAQLFKSSNSFKSRLAIGEMINETNSGNVYNSLVRIISIALLVELVGAILIYISLAGTSTDSSKVFFSVFHSISAFCNAGFSTLSSGIYDPLVVNNYFLQLVICWLIVTGGIGYYVMINHFRYIKSFVSQILVKLNLIDTKEIKRKRLLSINSVLVVYTTITLLILGTIGFYFLENNGVLAGKSFWHKTIVSLFNSVTARTAGFNNVDMGALGVPTILMIAFLMWIGASPGSTGGGIKTSTFAVSLLSVFDQLRGRDMTIIKWKAIPRKAINQVNAVIILSIIAISIFTFFLCIFERDKDPLHLFFEVVSAFSTVGLSINLTPSLSDSSKVVIISAMFLGRVSLLTFLIGMIRQVFGEEKKVTAYYPEETIFMN